MATEGSGRSSPIPTPTRLFFLILKLVSFKILNEEGLGGTGQVGGDGKILKPVSFTFDFCFLFCLICFFLLYEN